MDYLSGATAQTSNTDAAAALGVLIPMREEKRWARSTGAVEQVVFYFHPQSECGKFETGEMIRAWDDPEWHHAFARHPLAYMRVFFRNRHRLRDHFRDGVPLAAAWRAGKMELLTLRERPPRTEPFPPRPTGDLVRVDDDSLAAAFMAVGIPLFTGAPWIRTGQGVVYQFHPVSPCGQFSAAALAIAWEQENWYESHRTHPFAYVSCAKRNHDFLVDQIRRKAPTVVMMKNGLPCTLPADAPDDLQRIFFKEFNRR